MEYFQEIKELIDKNNLAAEGCSEADIVALEKEFARPFPAAYREFLLLFGHNPAGFFSGGSYFEAYQLRNMQEEADEILTRNGEKELGSDEFVFFIHQNYSFYFFKLNGEDDPDIFLCIEGGEVFERGTRSEAFSSFIVKNFYQHLTGGYLKRKNKQAN